MNRRILKRISESAIWRSIFRTGIPDTDLKRSMFILTFASLNFL